MNYYDIALNTSKLQNLALLRTFLQDEKIKTLRLDNELKFDTGDPRRDACTELVDACIAELEGNEDWLDVASGHYQSAVDTLPKLSRGTRLANKLLATPFQPVDSGSADHQVKLLSIAARLGRNDVLVQMEAGQRLRDAKAIEAATPCFYQATKLAPEDWRTHTSFARCLIKLNKHAAAVRPLQTAIRLNADHAIAHRLLAEVADAIGDSRLSRKHKRAAQELDADVDD